MPRWFLAPLLVAACGSKSSSEQSTDKPPPAGVTRVDVGPQHVCAVHATGTVSCWGRFADGARATPFAITGVTGATDVAGDCALTAAGITCWRVGATIELHAVPGTQGARALARGTSAPCFVTAERTAACIDDDLATVTAVPRLADLASLAPVANDVHCGVTTAGKVTCSADLLPGCDLLPDHTVRCVGGEPPAVPAADQPFLSDQVIRAGGTVRTRHSPYDPWRDVRLPAPATELSCDREVCCAVLATGAVACWGDNREARLGDGIAITRVPPHRIRELAGVRSIAASHEVSVALTDDGTLYAWGMGVTSSPRRFAEHVELAVAAEAGVVYATTDNHVFIAGTSDPADRAELPALPGRATMLAIGSGSHVGIVCALLADHRTACLIPAGAEPGDLVWRDIPELRDAVYLSPSGDMCGLTARHAAVCIERRDGAYRALAMPVPDTAVRIAFPWVELSTHEVLELTLDGDRWRTTPRPELRDVTGIAHGGDDPSITCGVRTGTALCWERDKPAPVAGPFTATAVAAGTGHACALTTDHEVWCWGDDGDGQVGTGRALHRDEPKPVQGPGFLP